MSPTSNKNNKASLSGISINQKANLKKKIKKFNQ